MKVHPSTDAGNAELFAHLYGNQVRYDHRRRRWLLWEKHWWVADNDAAVVRLAIKAARHRYKEAATIADLQKRAIESKWAIASESRQRLDACLALASALKPIADAGDSWNANPYLLGVANGVVNLKTAQLRDGRPEDLITQHVPIPYDLAADCPRWRAFLDEVFEGDAEVIAFIHRAVGYSLTGDTSEQCLFCLIGAGGNGKSVLLSTLRHLGGDYAHNMPFATIELNARASIPADVADLDGRRIVTASETAEGNRLNEARVKALTGSDAMTARHLYGAWFTFQPQAKFWLAVNHRPRVDDVSDAFWRRVRLIEFRRQFSEDADPQLLEKLRAEAPGILAWAVRGSLEWQRRGLEPPEKVKLATDGYRRDSDPLGDFIAEHCEVGPAYAASSSDLYARYGIWAHVQGLREGERLSNTKFGSLMSERFSKRRASSGRVVYIGIGLAPKGLPKGFVYTARKNDTSPQYTTPTRDSTENSSDSSGSSEAADIFADADSENVIEVDFTGLPRMDRGAHG